MRKLGNLLAAVLCAAQVAAQYSIIVNAQIIPPYSPYISTYVDNPNKLVLTLTNTSAQQQRVKLWVRIAADNGVSGTTSPGYQPAAPIIIPPFQTKVIDFSSNETKNYFDADNITLTGITKAQLIQNQALPEGTYTICVRAHDYNTGAQLSPDGTGCTAPFIISYIDPCILIQPACNTEVNASNPQNILFTWTPPATAPGNLKYEFMLKEVPASIPNYFDVIKNPAFPVVYTTTLTGVNSLLYTNALPQLTPGKKYVWRVRCIDPANSVQFKNQGYSEACTFVYKAGNTVNLNISGAANNALSDIANISTGHSGGSYFAINTPHQGVINIPPQVLPGYLNGKLLYKWPTGPSTTYPMGKATIRLKVVYYLNTDNGNEIPLEGEIFDNVPYGKELAVTTTDENGNFSFSFLVSYKFGKISDKKHQTGSHEFIQSGFVYRYAVVEILNPHNRYYLNPTDRFILNAGETKLAGDVIAPVKYGVLEVAVKRAGQADNQMFGSSTVNLPDANVYLCRKAVISLTGYAYPQDDGLPDEKVTEKPEALGNMLIVAKAKTNSSGKAVFDRVVIHESSAYQYYIYVDFDKNKTGFYSYKFLNGPVLFNKSTDPGGGKSFVVIDPGRGEKYYQTLTVHAQLPRIAGVVIDKHDGKPISGITRLESIYVGNDGNALNYGSPAYLTQEEKEYISELYKCSFICSKKSQRHYYRWPDGTFEFNNLPVLYEKNSLKPVGPLHCLVVKANGYDTKLVCVPNTLSLGSQFYTEIKLERGATISGRVVDSEKGTGLAANFYFLDENKSGKCNADGHFKDYPAKKLSYKQKLIIAHRGYITDTIEVLIDKEKVDIGTVKLGTIKRRLQVIVKDEDGNYLGDAPVEIVGVSVPCQELNNNSPPGSTCPLVKKTVKYLGTAYFAFENAGGLENNHQMYTIRVGSPEDANYEAIEFTTTIPYSSKVKSVTVTLSKATCLSGYVYAGKGNNSPVAGAKVKMDINLGMSNIKLGELETVTDANGYFMLKGVPMRSYPQVVRAMKSASNLIGDSVVIVTKPASQSPYYNYNGSSIQSQSYPNTVFSANISPGKSSSCITHDFHLTVYNDMDITNLMGFPMEVTALKPSSDNGAVIDGYFTSLPGNNQFKPAEGASLAFKQIKIIPSQTLKNDKGVPVAMPASVPVNTENNQLPLSLYGALNGLVEDKNLGIYIDKEVQGKQYGVIKGKVKLLATSFNQSVVSFDDAPFLALPGISNASKMIIPVLNADKSVSNPVNAPNGFKLCNSSGNPLKISLPGFPGKAISDYEATTYFKDEITLGVKLQTDIKDISPANLNLSLNNIKIKKGSNTSLSGNTAISFNLGNWKLTSNDFVLDQNGLKLNKGAIDAGITLPFTNILIKHDQLVTNAMQVQVSNLKLLGIHPVNVVSDNISFGLVQIPSGKKAWQVYVAPAPQVAANIQGLPAFGTADKIELSSIALQSNGEQRLTLRSTPVTLHNLLKFYPIDGSYISISPNQFLIPGSFNLKLHQTNSYSTTLAYEKNGNALQFNMVNTQMVTFNHPAALAHKFSVKPTLTDGKFTYSGYSEEPGVFPLTKTTLYYTNDSVSVWIDPGQNIPISNERKFSQAEGGMRLENGNWTTFWFSGAPEGMAGVSDVQVNGKKQRMKFTINGQVTADGQSISVKNVETPFGNMSWVYDFPASRLTGHMNVNMDINSMKVQGQINSIVDGSGWFFGADGIVEVQGLGEINFAGMFGNYPKYPANVSLNLGDFKCLPSDFTGKVNGFLFQAGLKKQVVPEISFSVPALLDVRFGVDVGLTTRLWKSFAETGKTMGISLLAKGIAYAKGECEATCSSVNAAATAEVGISGIYNGTTGQYSITGCGSIGFTLAAEQCLGAAGICVDACVGVDIGEKNLGVNMIYNSNTGVDMGIQFTSCSSVCN